MKKLLSLLLSLLIILTLCSGMTFAADKADEHPVNNVKVYASSENKNGNNVVDPTTDAIDGDMATYWFTQITNPDPMPHYITLEYSSEIEVGGLRWYPRQDSPAGRISTCEVYLSNDNKTFQKVADGKGSPSSPETLTFTFDKNYKAKFIRLQFTKTHGDLAGAAEIRVLKPIAGKATEALNPTIKAESLTNGVVAGGSSGLAELPVTFWKATASSTNANNNVPAEVPKRAFDNNLKTHWQSRITPRAMPPHYIAIELPEIQAIGGLRYYPRPDSGVGIASKYEVWLSYDNVNYQKVAEGDWELNTDVKDIVFDKNYQTKFIRFRIIEGSINFGSAAEIRALAPDSKKETALLTPTVKASEIGGTENTGIVECEEIPAVIDDTVLSLDELSVKGWTFDVSSFNKGREPEKAIDGDVSTWWFTNLEPQAEKPPHHITMILPEETAVSGLRYYECTQSPAGRCTKYEVYVSHDGVSFEKIAYGQWENAKNNRAVYFPMNVKVKAVKFVVLGAHGDYGAAGEIRLVKENPEKETVEAKDFVEKKTKYNLVETVMPGIEITSNKPENYPAINMFDENAASYYSTKQVTGEDAFPININFNLKGSFTLNGIRYFPVCDDDVKGKLKDFDVEYSLDGVNYTKIGNYKVDRETVDFQGETYIFDTPVTAKYVRIVVNDALGLLAAIGELRFLQTEENQFNDLNNSGESYVLKIGSNEIKVKKNGVETTVTTDVAPFIRNGSTLIPLRGLLEQMEAKVNWIDYDQKIEVVTQNGTYMLFQIENPRVFVDKVRHGLPVAPMIKDGRTFIPLRFVSENMGYTVGWDGAIQEITITN